MSSPVSSRSWSNSMKDGTDFNDQSSMIFEFWNKYHKSKNIKDAIQFIIDDMKNKIIQTDKYRWNSYLSALMNFFSTILNAMVWEKIGKASGENSRSSLTTGASTFIQASCTLGDLIHAEKANSFIDCLQEILNIMRDLEDKQYRLSIQVTTKLSNINV